MKTHFEWQTPKLALSRKATKAIEQTLRPAIQRSIPDFAVFAVVLMLAVLLWSAGGPLLKTILLSAVIVAFSLYLLVPLQTVLMINIHLRQSSKPSVKIRITDDRIFFPTIKKIGFYKYADIQSFWIAMERYEDGRAQVLKLQLFDGREAVFPLDDEVPVEELRQFLQGRITAARNRSRQLFTRRKGSALKKHAIALMFFSALCVLVFTVMFISSQSRLTASCSAAADSAAQVDATQALALSVKASEAFEALAGFALLFLLGCVLMLWGDTRYLRARLARIQAYLPDSALNQRQKAGDM